MCVGGEGGGALVRLQSSRAVPLGKFKNGWNWRNRKNWFSTIILEKLKIVGMQEIGKKGLFTRRAVVDSCR